MHQVFSASPIFGVEYTVESESVTENVLPARVEEDTSLITEDQEDSHVVAAYYMETSGVGEGGQDDLMRKYETIEYDPRLGLAIEMLPEGMSIEQLWKVV